MNQLDELRGRRKDVWERMQTMLEDAGTEGMTPATLEEYKTLEAEYKRLDENIKALERRAQTLEEQNQPRPVPEGIGMNGAGAQASAAAEERAYNKAFARMLRGARQLPEADLELLKKRAQSVGIPSDGGYLVPTAFRTKLVERLKAYGGLAANVEEFSTGDGRPVEWPTIDDTGNTGAVTAEGAQASSGADLDFGTATLGAYKYTAAGASGDPFRYSFELAQDAAFDVEALIIRFAGIRIARAQAAHWINGTGVSQPKGLVHGKTGVQIAANTGITFADLVAFVHGVDPMYRMGSPKWAFNDASLKYLRQLVDDNGRPLWLPEAQAGMTELAGGTLLGYPVIVDQGFSDINLSSGTVNWGAFGDFNAGYVIRRVQDVAVIVDPYSRAKFGQIEVNVWARADGVPQDPNAYIALTGKA